MQELERYIRTVKDFPKPGIGFKDITTLLKEPKAFAAAVDSLYAHFRDKQVHKVVAIESRGFIFGAPLALQLGVGFVPARKPKKLPAATVREEYQLEYGTDAVEIHVDAISTGERVVVIDDLLATGGTAAATGRLVERLGGTLLGFAFLIELDFLQGRKKLEGYEVLSLIHVLEE
ncbi:MAG: adenine phosphoribosyltransferase [candidate division KSB1 bacterium]|nr:adenine phosphoribosyltransferase [candidate division KSB1 bacterium]MDZ7301603.1 adenine phosphoribosyltransferase [candidate division KSB1 bacterium]MDZ7310981.1 adenine phosphoribosyltransferase [candidate division KSB1 bacterium]